VADPERRAVIERANYFGILAETVGGWALETFGGPERVVPCAVHMRREAQETWHAAMNLEAALLTCADEQTVQARKIDVAEECADLVILAMAMSAHAGFDLDVAFRKKMLENLDRQWNPPDHEGVITHRKDAV
jgi:NTP pyrophosphatase (non-canonical NTP hydrolase)